MAGPQQSARRVVRFGVFQVDLGAGELFKQGIKIRLQQQPLRVLALLLEHAGEVVTREDLRQAIWPAGTPVAAGGARVEELEFEASEVQRKAPERFLAACDAPMIMIERLAEAAQRAVDEGGRGALRVRFEAGTDAIEAAVEPLHA